MSQLATGRPGRPAASTRQAALALAQDRFLAGERIDVQAIARELGLARATMHRWFQTRDALLGETIAALAERRVAAARSATPGSGAVALLATCDRINREFAGSHGLRALLMQEHERALRILTSSAGIVQPRIVAADRAHHRGGDRRRRLRPAGRARCARLLDRAPGRGVPLQRCRRRYQGRRRASARSRGGAARRRRYVVHGARVQVERASRLVATATATDLADFQSSKYQTRAAPFFTSTTTNKVQHAYSPAAQTPSQVPQPTTATATSSPRQAQAPQYSATTPNTPTPTPVSSPPRAPGRSQGPHARLSRRRVASSSRQADHARVTEATKR